MAAATKFQAFVENLAEKVHNLGADAITVALSATATAPVATNSVLADLTQIAYTNLSTRAVAITSSAQSSGLYKLIATDLVLTAAGGSVAAFQYISYYNDTPTSPAKPLIQFYDYGSALTLLDTHTLTLDHDGTNGLLSLT